jgi:hypothetical protein
MKKYQTMTIERSVAASPPLRPPRRALKKTAGKKKNHTKGAM